MAGPDVETGVLLGVRESADLAGEVQKYMKKLVGIGEDGRKRGTEIQMEVGRLDVKSAKLQARVGIATGLVVVGDLIGDSYIVRSGVKEGEKVIVSNIQKLADGAPVKPEA